MSAADRAIKMKAVLNCAMLFHISFLFRQMMNKVFGGTVHKKSVREDGVFNITLDNTCSLFRYVHIFRDQSHVGNTGLEIAGWARGSVCLGK